MPPFRSMSAIKPVKTERTHEENQERYDAHLLPFVRIKSLLRLMLFQGVYCCFPTQ